MGNSSIYRNGELRTLNSRVPVTSTSSCQPPIPWSSPQGLLSHLPGQSPGSINLYLGPGGAETEDHKLGGSRQQRCIVL